MSDFATIRLNSDVKPLSGFKLVTQFCATCPNQEYHYCQQNTVKNPMHDFAAQFLTSHNHNDLADQRLAQEAKRIPIYSQCIKKFIHYTTPSKNYTKSPLTMKKASTNRQLIANLPRVGWLTFRPAIGFVFLGAVTPSRLTTIIIELLAATAVLVWFSKRRITRLWQKSAEIVARIGRGSRLC